MIYVSLARVTTRVMAVLVVLMAVMCSFMETAVYARDVKGLSSSNSVLVETESFDDYGGWSLDTQFMDQMGSPYLIAHGIGKPVENASTTVKCPKSGKYRVWVRTFDWVGRWRGEKWPKRKRALGKAPGRFTVLVNGKAIDGTFGIAGENWHWHKGPVVKLKKGTFKLALKDMTGFDGRCDAILFTQQKEVTLPNSDPEMKVWRKKLLGLSFTPRDAGRYDMVVVGGGVAGMCSAMSASRNGCKVALIQDRPVLGGNTSSEVCVNISGKLGFKPYPNIGNIVKEIQPDKQGYWHKGPFETGVSQDVKRLKLVQAEKNITLFLNHRVNDVEMDGGRIKAVLAENTKTGELVKFNAKLFADCTGDGCVGSLAKADFAMVGQGHMGRSNLWFVHDIAKPTTFPRCEWALDLYGYDGLREVPTKIDGWYWESGYNHDPFADSEYIRDWNLRAAYGTWDAHKNERKRYKTHEIKWMAFVSGKRESRCLLGDVILNGDDILSGKKFEDGCVPLSWRLDVHRPDPEYIAEFEGDAFIAKADVYGMKESKYKGPYWMPYRCLYSRDVPNLFMAGRNISATQDALGAARVQRTTGMMGEIVGLAASICKKHNIDPRGVYLDHLDELKELMKEGVGEIAEPLALSLEKVSDKEFKVADFGAIGDGVHDDGPAIIAAFAAAKKCTETATVVFAKKTYKLGDNPKAWHYFVINDFSDLMIEGNGATLVCSDANLGFHFNGGRDITIRNLTFDVSKPRVTQGKVIAIDKSGYMDVKIMVGYPCPPDEAFLKANGHRAYGGGGRHMIVFEKGGKSRNTKMTGDHLYISNIKKISPDVFRFFIKDNYMPVFAGVSVGNWVSYGLNKVSLPATVVAAKNKSASFYAQIAADRVENITFENINIYGSLNGGIRVSDMPGDVTLRNINITRKPGTQNLLSTCSDALHLMNIRGRMVMENCTVEAPGDDCLNIGTLLEKIISLSPSDKKTITLRTLDNRYYYYTIQKGDRLQFYDTEAKRILGIAKVTSAVFNRKKRSHKVKLDRVIDGLNVEKVLAMNLKQMTSSTVIANNIMIPYMRNALLARAQNMTIENNKIDCSHGGVIGLNMSMGDTSFGEKAQCRNIRIKGNTFTSPDKIAIVLFNPYKDVAGVYDAQRIEIVDNIFDVGIAKALRLDGIQGLLLRGNTFKKDGELLKDTSEFTSISNCVDATGAARAPRNFVVIFADDFGYGDMGCYRELFKAGDDRTLAHEYTPNIDKLGRSGVRFMQAYTCSWCAPSRQNLLSGRWCNRADNILRPWIGKQLRDAGYSTCFVGKSHGNNSSAKVLNVDPATAEYNDGFFMVAGMRKFYLRRGEKFPRRVGFMSQPYVAKGGEYITDVFTDFSADFIKRSADAEKPFFLYLAYNAPHSPLDGKLEDLQEMFPGEFDNIEEADWRELLNASGARDFKPEGLKHLTGVRTPVPGWSAKTSPAYKLMEKMGREKFIKYNFAALVYAMDRGIGKIMQTLQEAGVEDDTMVIFTSDNGSIMGSNYPLTGFKASHFEGGVRVPMIFWSKSLANSPAKGRIVEEITPTTDIAPSLVGMARKTDKPDFPFDGINLWPYLANNSPVPDDQVFYFASDTSQFYKANGLYRESLMRSLSKEERGRMAKMFGSTDMYERIFNAVYVKGKEKVVYWSKLDGSARGAVYKELPTGARTFENPAGRFKEELVVDGQFPESKAGKKLLKEFAEYTATPGSGELMHAAVFKSNGNHDKEKRARDYVNIAP